MSGWTIIAAIFWVAVGVIIGLLAAAILIGARRDEDAQEGAMDDTEDNDE